LQAQAAEVRSVLENAPSSVEAGELHALSGLAGTCGAEQLHAALKAAENKLRSGGSIAPEELIGLIRATTAEIITRQPQLS
jgi:HPt (histidine-containing phosphotransfer) domain-containing protein